MKWELSPKKKGRKQLQHIVLTTKTAGRGDFPS